MRENKVTKNKKKKRGRVTKKREKKESLNYEYRRGGRNTTKRREPGKEAGPEKPNIHGRFGRTEQPQYPGKSWRKKNMPGRRPGGYKKMNCKPLSWEQGMPGG